MPVGAELPYEFGADHPGCAGDEDAGGDRILASRTRWTPGRCHYPAPDSAVVAATESAFRRAFSLSHPLRRVAFAAWAWRAEHPSPGIVEVVPDAVSPAESAVPEMSELESGAVSFRSDVTVQLVRANASDADVLFAARVSTQGEQTLEAAHDVNLDTSRSAGLINYLMRDRHGSPFEHNSMTFYVQAPIFVFREFMRHRIASYNEESGRYRELRGVFYVPGADRNLLQVGKPGAYDFLPGSPEQTALVSDEVRAVCTEAFASYQRMLDAGIAREVARIVLPLTIYSSMYVTMNARALMNFLSLRTKREGTHFPSYPQREIEMVAEKMEVSFAELMPLTYSSFNGNGRVTP